MENLILMRAITRCGKVRFSYVRPFISNEKNRKVRNEAKYKNRMFCKIECVYMLTNMGTQLHMANAFMLQPNSRKRHFGFAVDSAFAYPHSFHGFSILIQSKMMLHPSSSCHRFIFAFACNPGPKCVPICMCDRCSA